MKAVLLHGAKDLRLENFRMPDLLPGMVLLRIKRVGTAGRTYITLKMVFAEVLFLRGRLYWATN